MADIAQGQGRRNYNVDIVMCIDATGSMRPIIDEVKRNALSFYKKFVNSMEEAGKEVDQLRIKVIAFRDYGYDDEPMVSSEFFNLPDQNEEFESFVKGIEAKGGGDEPENALEAIAYALKSDWTTGGARRRHVILVFSDASALPLGARKELPPGSHKESTGYPEDLPKNIGELSAWWAGTDQSFASTSNYQARAGRLVAFVPNAEPWTDMQGWSRYWPAFFHAGTGLEEVDFNTAIDSLFELYIAKGVRPLAGD